MASGDPQQALQLAEEYFSAEDDRFLGALSDVTDAELIAPLADAWKVDPRPWAHEQKLLFFRLDPDRVGHQPIVKRLFKQAEEDGDDQVLAAAASLFDRLVRHRVSTRNCYDWRSRAFWTEEYLEAECGKLPNTAARTREGINPFTGQPVTFHLPPPPADAIYFSYATRYYLQRRAWRYYKRLARQGAERYLTACRELLLAYTDDDLDTGPRILDSRTLLQAAFGEHPALRFGRDRVTLAEGGSLSQLTAAPLRPEHWQAPAAFDVLIDLARRSRSRLVRVWALQLTERHHAERVANLPVEVLLELILSEDPDVQQFAETLLKDNLAIDRLPIETWLRLIDEAGPNALPAICAAMSERGATRDLNLSECVDLAVREPSAAARLGLNELKTRNPTSEEELDQVARLADTACDALAGEAADWALSYVGSRQEYDRDHVSRFFDSLRPAARRSAWAWLESDDCPGRDDPVLFCRLLETPYDELKLRVIDLLERRNLPGEARGGLTAVWTAVLLGVHRGGRQKLAAVRQLAAAVRESPQRADDLVPVLAVAVRSIRKPESRAALAAVVGSTLAEPALADAVQRLLPELRIVPAEATA